MKAITCSQCGALVTEISTRDKFANCNYCGAKILIEENKERIIEIDKKEANTLRKLDPAERNRLFQTMVEQNNDYRGHKETADTLRILIVIVLIALPIIAPILITSYFKSKARQDTNSNKVQFVSTQTTPTPQTVYQPTETLPDINYETYVQYDTSIDVDLISQPVIEMGNLPSSDVNELKKTVFATRKIRVRVTIEENGDVSEAKALNGHKILQESSVEAAKKTLFAARKKKTTAVLTYIYILQ